MMDSNQTMQTHQFPLDISHKVSLSVSSLFAPGTIIPAIPVFLHPPSFEDDNHFSSSYLRVALDERSGPSFPGRSATCQYTLSENSAFVPLMSSRFMTVTAADKMLTGN